MYHSITFGDKNTWDDWRLIPTSRPVFAPPPMKSKLIEIPGRNGLLDISTIATGVPVFENREGSFEFFLDNDYYQHNQIYDMVMSYLHGKNMRATLEDDPEFYYEGRFTVSSWVSGKNVSGLTIDYNVAPYKTNTYSTMDDWLWDPFSFETGFIQYLESVYVSGTRDILIIGGRKRVSPIFNSSTAMSIKLLSDGISYSTVPNVSITFPKLIMKEGINTLRVTGTGTIRIDYRGGSL